MTQQELDALKTLADVATPTNRLERDGYHIYYRVNLAEWQAHAVFPGGTDEAIYYMAMRAAVPALIAEVEQLQAAWSAEHDAYIRADEQARMARREVERLRAELADYADAIAQEQRRRER